MVLMTKKRYPKSKAVMQNVPDRPTYIRNVHGGADVEIIYVLTVGSFYKRDFFFG